jgi:hypothetical protein
MMRAPPIHPARLRRARASAIREWICRPSSCQPRRFQRPRCRLSTSAARTTRLNTSRQNTSQGHGFPPSTSLEPASMLPQRSHFPKQPCSRPPAIEASMTITHHNSQRDTGTRPAHRSISQTRMRPGSVRPTPLACRRTSTSAHTSAPMAHLSWGTGATHPTTVCRHAASSVVEALCSFSAQDLVTPLFVRVV